jgi:hypothetical protein
MDTEGEGGDGGAEDEVEGAAVGGSDWGGEGGDGGGEVNDDAGFANELLESALESGEVVGAREEGDDRGFDGVEMRLDAGRERAIFFD